MPVAVAPTIAEWNQFKKDHQNDATDWDFIVLRSGMNNMLVTSDGGTVTVKAAETTEATRLRLTYGESILALKAEIEPGLSRLARVRGQASFQGSALAHPGSTIELKGVGGRFNGIVLMSAVHHAIATLGLLRARRAWSP